MGWCKSPEEFNFAKCYSPPSYPYKSSITRINRALNLLKPKIGNITINDIIKVLSDHYEGTSMYRKPPHQNKSYRTICTKRTVASMIAHLRKWLPRQLQLIWYCMSSPCISIYIPIYSAVTMIPEPYKNGIGNNWEHYDPKSAWWIFKKLQTIIDFNYDNLHPIVREKWDKLFNQIISETVKFEEEILRLINQGRENEAINLINNFTSEKLLKAYYIAKQLISELKMKAEYPKTKQLLNIQITIMLLITLTIILILYFKLKYIKS